MKIGIFGGSFDPVHVEHVRMASSAISCLGLDKLFVVPAATPPHKQGKRIAADEIRLKALSIAFEGVEKAEISRYELEQQGTSYTYLTCRHFKELYPDSQLYFLLGTDMLRDFPSWRNPEDILQNATIAVCGRAEESGWQEKESEAFYQRFKTRFVPITYEGKAVSSTEIRVRLAAGIYGQETLDERVEEYLLSVGVYAIPFADKALSLQSPSRRAHSLRVAEFAAKYAHTFRIDERKAITAALFHDCAKNLDKNSSLLQGFTVDHPVPAPVLHQYTGAYLAQKEFGIEDEEVLDAIRYHTSGRKGMTRLGKFIYLADALEEGRDYNGVKELRALLIDKGLDECLKQSLKNTLAHVESKGEIPYPLTKEAYEYYQEKQEK